MKFYFAVAYLTVASSASANEWNSWSGSGGSKPTRHPSENTWESSPWSNYRPTTTNWVWNGWESSEADNSAWIGDGWNWNGKQTPKPTTKMTGFPSTEWKTCTPRGSTSSCVVYPSKERQIKLTDQFKVDIITDTTYHNDFDAVSGAGAFLHDEGRIAQEPQFTHELIINGTDIACPNEANVVAASKCKEMGDECAYYFLVETLENTSTYAVYFYKAGAVTSLTPGSSPLVVTFPDLGSVVRTYNVVYKNPMRIDLPTFPSCNVPVGDNTTIAIACGLGNCNEESNSSLVPDILLCLLSLKQLLGVNETTAAAIAEFVCPSLQTPDFQKYVLPAPKCVFDTTFSSTEGNSSAKANAASQAVQKCLECVNKSFGNSGSDGTDACDTDKVCASSDGLSLITAPGCEDDEKEGTNGCVCNACGNVCPTACKSEIQTGLLCQFGTEQTLVGTNLLGGCQNANLGKGPNTDILMSDFSCAYVN